jgi:hypothetical protein
MAIQIFRQYPIINGFVQLPPNRVEDKTKYVVGNRKRNPFGTSLSSIKGFGGNGAGWNIVTNAAFVPTVVNDVLKITNSGVGNTANAFWNTSKMFTAKDFTISFTYTGQNNGADGVAFVVQDDPAGINAIGATGDGLGYRNITRSFAYGLNIFQTSRSALSTSGANFSNTSTSPVNLRNTNPKNVTLTYNSVALTITELIVDTIAVDGNGKNLQYTKTHVDKDLAAIIGNDQAYYGFTGSTGGSNANQTISNFVISMNGVGGLDSTQNKDVVIPKNAEYFEFLAYNV